MERLNRKDIKKAPYNPRAISPAAKKELEKSLKRDGLVMPLVVNKTTGNLVAGHQRLAQLDALAGTDDYFLDFAVIELPVKEEMSLNVFLNNEKAQGYFDEELLIKVLQEVEFSPSTGFDVPDIEIMFGSSESAMAREALNMISADVEKMATLAPPQKPPAEGKTRPDERFNPYTEKMERVQDANHNITAAATNTDHYLYVVFKTNDERVEFLRELGELEDQKYVNGTRMLATVKQLAEGAWKYEDLKK